MFESHRDKIISELGVRMRTTPSVLSLRGTILADKVGSPHFYYGSRITYKDPSNTHKLILKGLERPAQKSIADIPAVRLKTPGLGGDSYHALTEHVI